MKLPKLYEMFSKLSIKGECFNFGEETLWCSDAEDNGQCCGFLWPTHALHIHLQVRLNRRKIRLIESNAKCRYLKKFTCKWTLRQVFYLSEALSPSYHPILPPLHTVYVYTGKGGGS